MMWPHAAGVGCGSRGYYVLRNTITTTCACSCSNIVFPALPPPCFLTQHVVVWWWCGGVFATLTGCHHQRVRGARSYRLPTQLFPLPCLFLPLPARLCPLLYHLCLKLPKVTNPLQLHLPLLVDGCLPTETIALLCCRDQLMWATESPRAGQRCHLPSQENLLRHTQWGRIISLHRHFRHTPRAIHRRRPLKRSWRTNGGASNGSWRTRKKPD